MLYWETINRVSDNAIRKWVKWYQKEKIGAIG